MKKNLIEVMVSFDTTGSMYPCLTQVRQNVEKMVMRLFSEIAKLRIGVIAHGDYCDARIPNSYVVKMLDLTSTPAEVCEFIRTVGKTDGGDLPECYELVLHKARTEISWTAGATKVMVLIGDNVPHRQNETQNYLHLNWRNELSLMLEAGIQVYGVHALGRHNTSEFYEEVARMTGGYCLELSQFHHVQDMIMAVCLKQVGYIPLIQFQQAVEESGRMDRELDAILAVLLDRSVRAEFEAPHGLEPVPPGRFQVLNVEHDQSIRDFVEDNGLAFKQGRGFYEFTKRVTVQEQKEVVLLHNASGAMYTGAMAREMIGLPLGQRGKVSPKKLDELEGFTIFIQSTSVNRHLINGTRFLYEVEEWDRVE